MLNTCIGMLRSDMIERQPAPPNFTSIWSIRGRAHCVMYLIGYSIGSILTPISLLICAIWLTARAMCCTESTRNLKHAKALSCAAIGSVFYGIGKAIQAFFGVLAPSLYFKPFDIGYRSVMLAHAETDATYPTDGSGSLDISYVNKALGYGLIVGGYGHSRPDLQSTQDKIFHNFIQRLDCALTTLVFSCPKDINSLNSLLDTVQDEIASKMTDCPPAVMFAQVIKDKNQRLLFVNSLGKTTLMIRSLNGNRRTFQEKYGPPFSSGVIEVSPGDEIIGLTNGISDFLTQKEYSEIIQSNEDRSKLLEELKKKIIQKGVDHRASGEAAVAGSAMRIHDPHNPANHDDISLFTFTVT